MDKIKEFTKNDLKSLYKPEHESSKEDNGQVVILGGSILFHGAPILALKTASRVVDMVFFSSPEPSVGEVASKLKAQLCAFVWVPWQEVEEYLEKADAILIGPGFMRFAREKDKEECVSKDQCGNVGKMTKEITEKLCRKFSDKQWVIDAGSLQTMEARYIPKKAILTPNKKEFVKLFGCEPSLFNTKIMAQKYDCIIVDKGVETFVVSPKETIVVKGGNAGLTKGGTGDTLAGLTVALAAKNPPILAASAASYIVKKAAEELFKKVGFHYSADDLADKVPEVFKINF